MAKPGGTPVFSWSDRRVRVAIIGSFLEKRRCSIRIVNHRPLRKARAKVTVKEEAFSLAAFRGAGIATTVTHKGATGGRGARAHPPPEEAPRTLQERVEKDGCPPLGIPCREGAPRKEESRGGHQGGGGAARAFANLGLAAHGAPTTQLRKQNIFFLTAAFCFTRCSFRDTLFSVRYTYAP